MKTISAIGCVAAIVVGMAAPASAATTDPEVIIYRFPGVRDNGGGGRHIVKAFFCTNFSGASETIRFVTRTDLGTLLTNQTTIIPHLQTTTAVTHTTTVY